jgi:glycosyltransferase involved in cell wall biosynthesis
MASAETRQKQGLVMQVFLYLKHFPPAGDWLHDGPTKAVHGLAGGLVAAGAQVTVLCENTQTSQHKTPTGYTIACFRNARAKSEPSLHISRELKDFLRQVPPDSEHLVILNGIFHRSVYGLSRFLRRIGMPYIAAPHDPYHPNIFQTKRYLKLPYWHLLEKPMLQQAAGIQVLDPRHEAWLRGLGVTTAVVATPNGFEPSDVIDAAAIAWEDDGQRSPELYSLGRIDQHHKGLDILIQSVAEMSAHTPLNLTMQGPDCGDRKQLQQQIDRIGSTAHFLEADYARSAATLIAGYDIFCLTSRFEGFGLVALEAMLAGRVLLVSEVAGIVPHVLASGCGIVITPTVAGVQQGLEELLKRRSEWQTMGLQGRRYVLEHLQWRGIATQALGAYSQLLEPLPSTFALSSG